jgi:hypothetical protein
LTLKAAALARVSGWSAYATRRRLAVIRCGKAGAPSYPAEFDDAVHGLDPASTLVIVASKTFTTQETMMNAAAARDWIVAALGQDALAKHGEPGLRLLRRVWRP